MKKEARNKQIIEDSKTMTQAEVARKYNLSRQRIHCIVKGRKKIHKALRERIEVRCRRRCQECGEIEWEGCIHHIDKNPANNSEDNLTLLCVKCHINIHSFELYRFKKDF